MEHIQRRSCSMLFGPPGAGKTTAGLHVLELAHRRGYLAVRVDLSRVAKHAAATGFWHSLHAELQRQISPHGLVVAPIDSGQAFQLALLSLPDPLRLVLMLDDFDALADVAPQIRTEVSDSSPIAATRSRPSNA
jgi:hypothetical protein